MQQAWGRDREYAFLKDKWLEDRGSFHKWAEK